MNSKTTVSNQQVNDVIKIIDKQYPQLEHIEKIKVAIAFGQTLEKNKDFDYYEIKKLFENDIIEKLL